jgi:tetratricopeptide (TPR) repeat protein
VVIFYVFLFIFPHPSRLNLDHHFTLSHSLLDPPTTLLSILAVCCLIAMATIKARRAPLLSFCIIWFLGNLVIESSVIGLEIAFEHRTYLPTILFSIVLVTIIYRFVNHQWTRRLVLCLIVATGSIWTHERNQVWGDSIALWTDSANKSPGKARPYVNLGIAHKDQGQLERAISYLSQAVRLKPEYAKAHYSLSTALLSKGDYRNAESHAREALSSTPNDTDTLNLLGIALAGQGRVEDSINSFLQALDLNPHEAGTHYNLSLALANAGQLSKAEQYCLEALRIEPDYRPARMHLYKVRSNMKLHKLPIERPFMH